MSYECPIDTWTPQLVATRLIEAVRWARYGAGPVGPSGIRSGMPTYAPTWEDRMAEGWGLPELAGDETQEDRPLRVNATPEQVGAYMAALQWQAAYLVPAHVGSSRVLGLWLRCRVARRSFDAAIKDRPHLSRANAYRLRDRALSIIAQGLQSDGVPL